MNKEKQMTENSLIEFEKDIFDIYSEGKIEAPVHLTGSVDGRQEKALIKIFLDIKKNDWVFSTHRSHYHALLKAQDAEWVKSEILAKRSIHINSKKHKIFTSAIVGGILPIALGVAFALKKKKSKDKVWVFVGDMASQMGIFFECWKYALGHNLPITFIIEDNEIGVYTPTEKVWKFITHHDYYFDDVEENKIIYYDYKRKYPHVGIGKWVVF